MTTPDRKLQWCEIHQHYKPCEHQSGSVWVEDGGWIWADEREEAP